LITVRGGEDYQFRGFSLKVIPSIHHEPTLESAGPQALLQLGYCPAGMKAPLTLEQIHSEGGTLAYLVRFPNIRFLPLAE
jgi:hypothetical protein